MERANQVSIRLTENFEHNLVAIDTFWRDAGVDSAYDSLLDNLEREVISTLERFPRIGRRFVDHQSVSVEAIERTDKLQRWLITNRAEVHEYIFEDYLVLYAVIDTSLYLLAIRHHRQLSFDLKLFW